MSIDADHLATRLGETISSTPGAGGDAMGWLWPALLRELARGRPVTVEDLTRVTGRSATEVRDGLGGLSDTEYDETGAVLGHGITLRETPHRFTVDGQVLYTWCALDTLIFPTVLDRPAHVVSPTPGNGEPVTLSVDPAAGVTALDPATAVVSVLVPDGGSSVRASFCDQVHFFATPAAAQDWLVEHPGGTVLSVADAFDLGRRLAHDLVAGRPGCC
ncbi:organomercurial lyase MerB [Pseudonocardia broussonetiae]|uniref:organomercurial lyase MerB n=1 Tax=Pseudonocardia broussonetiae TaxID=2736640 RepID=UPI001F0355B4|nr:organomercurial lyase MerB [Pseudonocardia broussonetiae]